MKIFAFLFARFFLIGLMTTILVGTLQAQFGTPVIINGDRYIVNTSRINGAITIESWPMPKTQQRNYNHARKYGSPRSTYSAPSRTYSAPRQPRQTYSADVQTFMPVIRTVVGFDCSHCVD